MLSLLLCITCSIGTAMLLKLGEHRELDRSGVLAVNYVLALAMALALSAGAPGTLKPAAAALAAVTGALFFAGYFAFGAAIRRAGVGLATGIMRLSVAVPVLGAWALFAEAPTVGQVIGLVLAGCAFFLLARPASDAGAGPDSLADVGLLAVVFLIGGAVDLAMKVFAHSYGPSLGHPAFLVVVFAVAAAFGIAMIVAGRVRGGVWPGSESVWLGLLLGVVNYGSAAFMLRAAAELPASVVFPTNAIAVMVGAALLAVTLWAERLSRANLAGLVLAAAALALLWGGRGGGA